MRNVATRVARYYDANTEPFYLHFWDREEIHFGLFDARGPHADLRSALKRMSAAILSPAAITHGERVVDAGCGVGGAALDLAAQAGCTVLGLTVSPTQVAIARRRASERRLGRRARFRVADCSHELPVRSGSADVVYSIEAACHFADKDRFVAECARVLAPGGRLALSDWMAADGVSPRAYAKFLAPACEAWHLAGLDDLATWRDRLRRHGFELRRSADFAAAVLPNLQFLRRGRLELLLEEANGCHSPRRLARWKRQYETLIRAWTERRFTIGRLFAVKSPRKPATRPGCPSEHGHPDS